jgi:hypothetical protein
MDNFSDVEFASDLCRFGRIDIAESNQVEPIG